MIRSYSELIKLPTFEERFEYLNLKGRVGKELFGYDRYLNQVFYQSQRWKKVRREIILRDNGCDLGMPGFEIEKGIFIHHMNVLTKEDIERETEYLINPEYLITVSRNTHQAIHYGDKNLLPIFNFVERKPNDTKLW